jgi:predicted site-specific integrase-resolvase
LGAVADEENKKVIAYSRVSSHDQKEDLKRQSLVLDQYCKKEFSGHEVIEDLGSGMNYKKKGLRKLITMILSGLVSDIVLTHKDRLLRFGSELIFLICKFFGIRVHIIHEDKDLTDEQLLAFDVLEIITVFSARLYGKRSHKNVKITC